MKTAMSARLLLIVCCLLLSACSLCDKEKGGGDNFAEWGFIPMPTESAASILRRESDITIQRWLDLAEENAELTDIPLSREERTGHLPKLLQDIIVRLRLDSGLPAPISKAALDHGELRLRQGYTAAMVVEESRILQVSVFSTLQRNMGCVDFNRVLSDVVIIADECDSQLKQAILCYDAQRYHLINSPLQPLN
jgi:hypothetical protein